MRPMMFAGAVLGLALAVACTDNPASSSTNPVAPSATAHTISGTVSTVSDRVIALAGAAVTARGIDGTAETMTDSSGFFSLKAAGRVTFDVAKTGYEPDPGWNLRSLVMDKDWAVEARLQPIYLIAEASSLSATLDPGDRWAFVGEPYESDYCAPCKIFRLRTDSSSKIAIQLSWTGDAGLTLWALGGDVKAMSASGASEISVTISTVGGIESKVYVGLPLRNGQAQTFHTAVPFELTTSAP